VPKSASEASKECFLRVTHVGKRWLCEACCRKNACASPQFRPLKCPFVMVQSKGTRRLGAQPKGSQRIMSCKHLSRCFTASRVRANPVNEHQIINPTKVAKMLPQNASTEPELRQSRSCFSGAEVFNVQGKEAIMYPTSGIVLARQCTRRRDPQVT
jgi:hypothetical protein